MANAHRTGMEFQEVKRAYKLKGKGLSYILVPSGSQPQDYPYDPVQVQSWEAIYGPPMVESFILAIQNSFPANHGVTSDAVSSRSHWIQRRYIGSGCDSQRSSPRCFTQLGSILVSPTSRMQLITTRISSELTKEEISSGFRKWRETTSTSPSADLCLTIIYPYAPTPIQPPINTPTLMNAYVEILQLCLKCGLTLSRWHHVNSVMLEKTPGTPYLHKWRVIHLYEADYNFGLKRIARRLLWHPEDNPHLTKAKWGSQLGHYCVDFTPLQSLILRAICTSPT